MWIQFENDALTLKIVIGKDLSEQSVRGVRYSHSVVNEVCSKKRTILKENVLINDEFSSQSSIIDLELKMVYCVPLIFGDDFLGVIYTDSKYRSEIFSDEKRDFLDILSKNAGIALNNARIHQVLLEENTLLKNNYSEQFNEKGIVGESAKMRTLFSRTNVIAPTDYPVLLIGETGTGKDHLAKIIHGISPRKDKPFISINCAALPENLIESELFGYEKGAFTGATGTKKGKFELADKGTIFLNEIGELPLLMQAKLLTVLESQSFQRLGGTKDIHIDIRIIAATNRDLNIAMEYKEFRKDLFYRLSTVTLELPPLRERRDDIPLLVRHFLDETAKDTGRQIKGIEPAAMAILVKYDWKGNIRQLINVVKETVLFAQTNYITKEDLQTIVSVDEDSVEVLSPKTVRTNEELKQLKYEIEKRSINEILQKNGWNITNAAKEYGIDRTRLHHLIKKHKLSQ